MSVPAFHRLGLQVRPALAALALALMLGLSGCDALDGLIGQTSVPVLGGAVTVAAPSGYCVAPGQAQEAGDTAVVLLGRCLSTGLVAPAVITVSVGRAGSAGVMLAGDPALKVFFTSPQGLRLLARSGKAGDVALGETRHVGAAFLMHLNDRMAGPYWRAILGLNGRLITVSATGTSGLALSDAASLTAVTDTLSALAAANPARSTQPGPILPEGATQRPPVRPPAG
jgi:hypothetical protein